MWDTIIQKIADNQPLAGTEKFEFLAKMKQLDDVSQTLKSWQMVGGHINPAVLNFPIEVIYSQILEEDKSSISMGIPAKFNHLIIIGSGRCAGAGVNNQILFAQINGDSGTNYEAESMFGLDSLGADSLKYTSSSGLHVGVLTENGQTSGRAANFFTIIPHYTSSFMKSALSLQGATGGSPTIYQTSCLYSWWTGQTNPINSLRLVASVNMLAGTNISIYGIK